MLSSRSVAISRRSRMRVPRCQRSPRLRGCRPQRLWMQANRVTSMSPRCGDERGLTDCRGQSRQRGSVVFLLHQRHDQLSRDGHCVGRPEAVMPRAHRDLGTLKRCSKSDPVSVLIALGVEALSRFAWRWGFAGETVSKDRTASSSSSEGTPVVGHPTACLRRFALQRTSSVLSSGDESDVGHDHHRKDARSISGVPGWPCPQQWQQQAHSKPPASARSTRAMTDFPALERQV